MLTRWRTTLNWWKFHFLLTNVCKGFFQKYLQMYAIIKILSKRMKQMYEKFKFWTFQNAAQCIKIGLWLPHKMGFIRLHLKIKKIACIKRIYSCRKQFAILETLNIESKICLIGFHFRHCTLDSVDILFLTRVIIDFVVINFEINVMLRKFIFNFIILEVL